MNKGTRRPTCDNGKEEGGREGGGEQRGQTSAPEIEPLGRKQIPMGEPTTKTYRPSSPPPPTLYSGSIMMGKDLSNVGPADIGQYLTSTYIAKLMCENV